MSDPESLFIVGVAFLLGGFVKGVIGLGLPTVSLALLAATLGLKPAIVLLLAPSLATNLWQALNGDAFGALARRLWPMLGAIVIATWFGVEVLARSDAELMSALLGIILCLYAGLNLANFRVPGPGAREAWLTPLVGGVNGIITGMTGTFVVPAALYLQALALPRDQLVQAMGIVFAVSTATLALSLGGHRLVSVDLVLGSTIAVAPALFGMALGQRVRRGLGEEAFSRIFFGALALLGLYVLYRSGL